MPSASLDEVVQEERRNKAIIKGVYMSNNHNNHDYNNDVLSKLQDETLKISEYLDSIDKKLETFSDKFQNVSKMVATETIKLEEEIESASETYRNIIKKNIEASSENSKSILKNCFLEIMDGDFRRFKSKLSNEIYNLSASIRSDILQKVLIGNFDGKNRPMGGLINEILPQRFKSYLTSNLTKENSNRNLFWGTISNFLGNNPFGLLGKMPEARAIGGMVSRGNPYLVGENGPELFIPEGNGKIVPNNKLNSSRSINVTMNITTPDANSFKKSQKQIIGDMLSLLRRRGG